MQISTVKKGMRVAAVVCVKNGYYFSSSIVFGRCVERKMERFQKEGETFLFVMDDLSIINVFGLEYKKLQFV